MINPITCVCALMAAGSGLYMFQEKQQVQLLDRQVEQVLHAADAAHSRVGMLRAEYALLNDPSRLQELSRRHLPTLVNTAPTQFASLVELDRRLPMAGTAAESPAANSPAVAAEPTSLVHAASPAPPPPAATAVVAPPTATPPGHRAAPRTLPARAAPATPVAPPAMVATVPLPAHATHLASRATPRRTAGHEVGKQRLVLAYRGDPYPTQPVTAADAGQRAARPTPAEPGTPAVASALGMARSMPASTPVASVTAAAFYSSGDGGAQSR